MLMKTNMKPHPSSVYAKPQEFLPLIVTSRLNISLAYLDPVAKSSLPASRLFSGDIKALNSSKWNKSSTQGPAMLVARLISDGSIHVLEEVGSKVYACCKIGDWVELESLRDTAWAFRSQSLHKKDSIESVCENESTESMNMQVLEGERLGTSKRKKLERSESIQILMRKRPRILPMPTPPSSDNLEPSIPGREPESVESVPEELVNLGSECSPATILESIRDQYLVTLYTSKVRHLVCVYFLTIIINNYQASLAYFAKGPLSRARAAFAFKESGSTNNLELANLLQNLVQAVPALEKKYNLTMPTLIVSFPLGLLSDDEEMGGLSSAKKLSQSRSTQQKKQRFKIGRNGLHTQEPELIKRWWKESSRDAQDGLPGETRDQEIKRRLSDLRVREIQLQVVLILEVLALTAKCQQQISNSKLRDLDAGQSKSVKRRASKQVDLPVLIDLHVDKLTIWQSLRREILEGPEKRSANTLGTAGTSSQTLSTADMNDELGQFSAEVILPL